MWYAIFYIYLSSGAELHLEDTPYYKHESCRSIMVEQVDTVQEYFDEYEITGYIVGKCVELKDTIGH